jgi:hypothetical protein
MSLNHLEIHNNAITHSLVAKNSCFTQIIWFPILGFDVIFSISMQTIFNAQQIFNERFILKPYFVLNKIYAFITNNRLIFNICY